MGEIVSLEPNSELNVLPGGKDVLSLNVQSDSLLLH
jgi:hypothetical protein